MFKIVKDYAAMGEHRTGTCVDHATTQWFADLLVELGANVHHQNFSFDRYEAHSFVYINNKEIPSMPLYYETLSSIEINHVMVASVDCGEHGSELDIALDNLINQAIATGYKALVVATRSEINALVAINCKPIPKNRLPVILVAGHHEQDLYNSHILVKSSA